MANGDPVQTGTDMWSVGVLTYILLSGLSPFCGRNDNDTLKNVRNGDWNMDDAAFNLVSSEAKDFIGNLLVMNPKNRLSVKSALSHPWIQKNGNIDIKYNGRNAGDVIQNAVKRFQHIQDSVAARYVSF